MTVDESMITYLESQVAEEISNAAAKIPSLIGYDFDEERVIDSNVLSIEFVTK